jgi:N-acetylmuramoyl-L-alanine amidase
VGRLQGALTCSVFSKVPVVLVEMCVLTNPRDEAYILSTAGQEKVSRCLELAIRRALSVEDVAPKLNELR